MRVRQVGFHGTFVRGEDAVSGTEAVRPRLRAGCLCQRYGQVDVVFGLFGRNHGYLSLVRRVLQALTGRASSNGPTDSSTRALNFCDSAAKARWYSTYSALPSGVSILMGG